MKIKSLTDIGSKRSDNQDNYWCSRLSVDGEEAAVLCVCDGMGGLNKGGLASQIVVSMVKDFFKSCIDFNSLKEVLEDANRRVLELSEGSSKKSGTTCTVLFCYKGEYRILHIGDTRCYRLTKGTSSLLTKDHSVIQEYKRRGIKIPDNLRSKHKNSLTRCIGVRSDVSFDYISGNYLEGDTFVVCSDGLWHYFEGRGVCELDDLDTLISNCIINGETDNISICVLEI